VDGRKSELIFFHGINRTFMVLWRFIFHSALSFPGEAVIMVAITNARGVEVAATIIKVGRVMEAKTMIRKVKDGSV
jgi:hypothetical protein